MAAVAPMPRLDDKVGDRPGDRIDHDAAEIAAGLVLAGDFASDLELGRPAHRYLLRPSAHTLTFKV